MVCKIPRDIILKKAKVMGQNLYGVNWKFLSKKEKRSCMDLSEYTLKRMNESGKKRALKYWNKSQSN